MLKKLCMCDSLRGGSNLGSEGESRADVEGGPQFSTSWETT